MNSLQKKAKKTQIQVDEMADELQTLCRSTNGRLKLAHLRSYTEVVWASKGTLEEHKTATTEELEVAWRAVSESFWT